MATIKRTLEDQDPDYEDSYPLERKRLKLLEENGKADMSQKVSLIIQREFSTELDKKEKEIFEIQERIHFAQKTLHMLRYAVVKNFYTRKQLQGPESIQLQKRIHPAIRKLCGKHPRDHWAWESVNKILLGTTDECTPDGNKKNMEETSSSNSDTLINRHKNTEEPANKTESPDKRLLNIRSASKEHVESAECNTKLKKIPRYVPPTPGAHHREQELGRGSRHKIKKRFVIGNVSKWIPVDDREDPASHKWMMYVRGPKESPDISLYVSKVRFFLHPSYKPHDVVEITSHPFHLSRRGWGEFPVRVQIHFAHPMNKPVDIIHHLKLDRSYTGLQMLGAETIVDIWLYTGSAVNLNSTSDDEISKNANLPSEKSPSPKKQTNISESTTKLESNSTHPTDYVDSVKSEICETEDNFKIEEFNSDFTSDTTFSASDKNPDSTSYTKFADDLDDLSSITGYENSEFGDVDASEFERVDSNELEDLAKHIGTDSMSNHSGSVLPGDVDTARSFSDNNSSLLEENMICDETSIVEEIVDCDDSNCNDFTDYTNVTHSTDNSEQVCDMNSVENICESALNSGGESKDLLPCVVPTDHDYIISSKAEGVSYNESDSADDEIDEHSTSERSITEICDNLIVASESSRSLKVRSVSDLSALNNDTPSCSKNGLKENLQSVLKNINSPFVKDVSSSNKKLPFGSNVKPTTLVKCMDNNGKIFYIKLSSDVKFSNNSNVVSNSSNSASKSNPLKLTPDKISVKSALPSVQMLSKQYGAEEGADLFSNQVRNSSTTSMLTGEANSVPLTAEGNTVVVLPSVTKTNSLPLTIPQHLSESSKTEEAKASNGLKLQQNSAVGNPLLYMKDGKYYIVKQALSPNTKTTVKSFNQAPLILKSGTESVNTGVVVSNGSSSLNSIVRSASLQIPLKSASSTNSVINLVPKNVPSLNPASSSQTNCFSVAKPGSSLLKKNVQAGSPQLPLLIRAKSQTESDTAVSVDARTNLSFISKKKNIVLNPSQCSPGIFNRVRHEEKIRCAVEACKFPDQAQCVRWMLRHLPLICESASDPDYRQVHPYSCPSYEVFCSWNIGRQRATEWLRAKTVRGLLLKAGFTEDTAWSTRTIAKWAKFHGYTPVVHFEKGLETVSLDVPTKLKSTYSEPVSIMEWLETSHMLNSSKNSDIEIIEEIDVVNTESPKKITIKQEVVDDEEKPDLIPLKLESQDEVLCEFVRETSREIGVHLSGEEIVPGVLYNAAEKLLLEGMKSFMDNLLRKALFCAFRRNSFRKPPNVTHVDLQESLEEREEFDILTNSGLGVQPADTG